jgi:hypothetical protein
MPFDATSLRRPTVTVLPPTPPERGGGPQRIRIEIEIVDRRAPPPPCGYRFGTVILWLLLLAVAFALFGSTAQAQPSSWKSYQEGFVTRYQGTDAQGGQWTGNSYELFGTRHYEFNGPHGASRHCRSWQQDWQTTTECDP